MILVHDAPSLSELRTLSDEALVDKHDDLAKNASISTVEYYLNELHRREQKRRSREMRDMTETVRNLTIVITVLTAFNVVVAFVA